MHDDTLTPEARRELAAVDAALAGDRVDPDLVDIERLVLAVRDERERPSGPFCERLDARVAERFARPRPAGVARALGLVAAARARTSRRMLLPALGAAASLLLVVVVATSLLTGPGEDTLTKDEPAGLSAPATGGAVQERQAAPGSADDEAGNSTTVAPPGVAVPPSTGADTLPGRQDRRVERAATVALTTAANRIEDVADDVIGVTDDVGGIVVTSSVNSGERGGSASFQLRVPTGRLDEALEKLSKLAHVRSRTQNADDITGTFVSAEDRLAASRAERRGLLRQLAAADTTNETASVRARLRLVQQEIAAQQAELRRLRERTSFSVVNVTIDSDSRAGTGGGWTPRDALNDAVRILEVIAGVLLVSLAVLLPLGLLAGLAVFGGRIARRRQREQALDAT